MAFSLLDEIKKKEQRQEEPPFLTNTGLGPWSFSKLKVLRQCPLRFYLKYILRVKVPEPPPSLITNVGKAVHRVLEFLLMGKSITDSFKMARKEFSAILSDSEWEMQVATTEFNIMEFRRRLDSFEQKNPVKRYIQELRIGMTANYEPTGFFADDVYWRGVIDLGMQLQSNDVIILDHKTGAPAEMGIRNFQNQLDTYKILFHRGLEPVNGAQAGIHFVKDGKIILDTYVTSKDIENKLTKELEFFITGSIDKMLDLGSFKHIRGPHCKYCEYNEECKAGMLKTTEDNTKRFFPIKDIT
jgi:hypothetical protein